MYELEGISRDASPPGTAHIKDLLSGELKQQTQCPRGQSRPDHRPGSLRHDVPSADP